MKQATAVALIVLSASASAAPAAEFFEGAWARTARECRDREGPGSGVLIDLAGRENGRPAPLFDQYEHHCRIEKVERSHGAVKLSLTCFEF